MQNEKTYIDKTLRYEARTYKEDKVCGKCSRGRMRPVGEPVEGKTPHACNYCKREASFDGDPFPRMVTEFEQASAAGFR